VGAQGTIVWTSSAARAAMGCNLTLVEAAHGVWHRRELEVPAVQCTILRALGTNPAGVHPEDAPGSALEAALKAAAASPLDGGASPGAWRPLAWVLQFNATVAGRYSLDVVMHGTAVGGSGMEVLVSAGAVDARASVAWGSGLGTSEDDPSGGLGNTSVGHVPLRTPAGSPHRVFLRLRDAFGNDIEESRIGLEAHRLALARLPSVVGSDMPEGRAMVGLRAAMEAGAIGTGAVESTVHLDAVASDGFLGAAPTVRYTGSACTTARLQQSLPYGSIAPTADRLMQVLRGSRGVSRTVSDRASGPVQAAWLLAVQAETGAETGVGMGRASLASAAACGSLPVAGAALIPFFPLSDSIASQNTHGTSMALQGMLPSSSPCPATTMARTDAERELTATDSRLYGAVVANFTNPGAVLQATFLPVDAAPRASLVPLLLGGHDESLGSLPGSHLGGGLARRLYARPGSADETDAGLEDESRKTISALARAGDPSCGVLALDGPAALAAEEEVLGAVTTAWGTCGPRAIGRSGATDAIGVRALAHGGPGSWVAEGDRGASTVRWDGWIRVPGSVAVFGSETNKKAQSSVFFSVEAAAGATVELRAGPGHSWPSRAAGWTEPGATLAVDPEVDFGIPSTAVVEDEDILRLQLNG